MSNPTLAGGEGMAIIGNKLGNGEELTKDEATAIIEEILRLNERIKLGESQLTQAQKRIEKLESALKFYADGREWSSMGLGAYSDIGKIAREALKEDEHG